MYPAFASGVRGGQSSHAAHYSIFQNYSTTPTPPLLSDPHPLPVAHGTLSLVRKTCNNPNCRLCASGERHPAWTFVFRKDGKARCMHVQPRHVEIVRKAVENGRKLEEMILDEGIALLERLREQE